MIVLETGLLLRIVKKELIPEKERLCLLYLCIFLKNTLNIKVRGLDTGLLENNGAAIINLALVGFLCNFSNQ